MPRAKVHPSQRQRAAEACNFCRESKKRCSGTAPCTACQRRGFGESCYLMQRPRGQWPPTAGPASASERSPSESVPSHGQQSDFAGQQPRPLSDGPVRRLDKRSSSNVEGHASIPAPETRLSASGATRSHHNAENPAPATSSGSPYGACEPRSRMLLNLRGDRVYVGVAASLSFLQLIRNRVTECLGHSQFTHNAKRDSMLEAESPMSSSNMLIPAAIDLTLEQKRLYSEVYHSVTGGFLDIFSTSELEGLLLGGNDTYISSYKRATIELIIAIGAQCHSQISSQQIGQPYFRRAQQHAFSEMLEDPNVEMIRVFLLMAFYMLGACRRNTAYMYLGIASRAAATLGLHIRDSYAELDQIKYQLRLKIWMSLCIMDMVVSSILGRPSANAALRSDLDAFLADLQEDAPDQDIACLIASYKIVRIINEAVEKVYDNKAASPTVAEQFLDRIESWSQQLPSSLQNASTSTSSQKTTIATTHVSCLYYFAISLVTRPFLVSTLTTRLPAPNATHHSQLASACLEAAVYLVQTCVSSHNTDQLHGNMCIMKALIFAAGLILGFHMFEKQPADYEVEDAFRGAMRVLEFLAAQSPQAAHYAEILALLASAVERQRERTSGLGRSGYVRRIFGLGGGGGGGGESAASPETLAGIDDAAGRPMADDADGPGFMGLPKAQPPLQFNMRVDDFLGWDSLDLLAQWDEFPASTS